MADLHKVEKRKDNVGNVIAGEYRYVLKHPMKDVDGATFQMPEVHHFTMASLDAEITRLGAEITSLQGHLDRLKTIKSQAEALPPL